MFYLETGRHGIPAGGVLLTTFYFLAVEGTIRNYIVGILCELVSFVEMLRQPLSQHPQAASRVCCTRKKQFYLKE